MVGSFENTFMDIFGVKASLSMSAGLAGGRELSKYGYSTFIEGTAGFKIEAGVGTNDGNKVGDFLERLENATTFTRGEAAGQKLHDIFNHGVEYEYQTGWQAKVDRGLTGRVRAVTIEHSIKADDPGAIYEFCTKYGVAENDIIDLISLARARKEDGIEMQSITVQVRADLPDPKERMSTPKAVREAGRLIKEGKGRVTELSVAFSDEQYNSTRIFAIKDLARFERKVAAALDTKITVNPAP